MGVDVVQVTDAEFEHAIPELARLRINVFREWPYLYDGDMEYEAGYLNRFKQSDRAFLAVALDGGEIVGATTAAPLAGELPEFKQPLEAAGFDVDGFFYFAESLLLPRYRGTGIGHAFFDMRETFAKSFGSYTHAGFCSVMRPTDHPERPQEYRALDGFWQKRGYEKLTGVSTGFSWKDIGEGAESMKPMEFWTKPL